MINKIYVLLLVFVFVSCQSSKKVSSTTNKQESMKPLQARLDARKAKYSKLMAEKNKKISQNGIQEVANSGITQSAIQVGQKAPNFTLTNHLKQQVNLYDILKKKNVVLTWYRGGWCPYCNLTLKALQDALPQIKAQKGRLLALTPEIPDKSLSTAQKHKLDFEVLTDLHNEVGKKYGIVYKVNKDVVDYGKKFFNMHKYNGDDSDELPLAATYVIDKKGIVKYAFLHADYTKRAEPSEIIKALKNIK